MGTRKGGYEGEGDTGREGWRIRVKNNGEGERRRREEGEDGER